MMNIFVTGCEVFLSYVKTIFVVFSSKSPVLFFVLALFCLAVSLMLAGLWRQRGWLESIEMFSKNPVCFPASLLRCSVAVSVFLQDHKTYFSFFQFCFTDAKMFLFRF